jgi:hypothetical protein
MLYVPQWLPPGFTLDESDPDSLVLRRTDGSFVAVFSSWGATREGILEVVEEDHQIMRKEPTTTEDDKVG